ncbi:MAG: HDOD domain-containing protein [Planctomycetes bacterium]|nr:HDOD domain-containing protein [Planctomycetota bacterium]
MQAFVARQPILDQKLDVYGYELLFRSGFDEACFTTDANGASITVISDSILNIGLDRLTSGKKAFINFTRELLVGDLPGQLPEELVVIEVLEDIAPDHEVLEACRKLRSQGYLVAIDDVDSMEAFEPFLDVVDIVKVDFMLASRDTVKRIGQAPRPKGVRLLAEKVETQEDYDFAVQCGYELFQGYFFSRPKIVTQKKLSHANPARLALLQAVHRPDIDFKQLEEVVKQDVGLTYRLLKYINSSYFGVRGKVHSIKQALVLLGLKNVRRWTTLIAIECMTEGKPSELMLESLIRAKFCELLKHPLCLNEQEDDLFLLGMLSLLDAILDMSMADILDEIPLNDTMRYALLGGENELRLALDVASSYQHADWYVFAALRDRLGFNEEQIPTLYYESVDTAEKIIGCSRGGQ